MNSHVGVDKCLLSAKCKPNYVFFKFLLFIIVIFKTNYCFGFNCFVFNCMCLNLFIIDSDKHYINKISNKKYMCTITTIFNNIL